MIRSLFALCFSLLCASAQQLSTPTGLPTPLSAPQPPPAGDGARVTVLGYHDFSETLPETEMRIRTSKFRAQMAALRQAGATVISMSDFLAWKTSGKAIPKESVLITIDDGWRSIHTDAFPILKEFGYPFTLFLYKKYIDGGGKALTSAMIKEMMQHGASLGSHSVSHPYPSSYRSQKRRGERTYDAFLRKEFGESKRHIEAKFATTITAYAYPGGYVTEEMFPIIEEFDYQALFTILPGRITRDTDSRRLPRYMILGTHDRIFALATAFAPMATSASHEDGAASPLAALPPPTPHPVTPESGGIIEDRLPVISADLSKAANLDPSTLEMEVSGFGPVPATFDSQTQCYSWQVTRRLRQPACQVTVKWKELSSHTAVVPLQWQFRIDRTGAYLPVTAGGNGAAEPDTDEGPASIAGSEIVPPEAAPPTGTREPAPGEQSTPPPAPPAPHQP